MSGLARAKSTPEKLPSQQQDLAQDQELTPSNSDMQSMMQQDADSHDNDIVAAMMHETGGFDADLSDEHEDLAALMVGDDGDGKVRQPGGSNIGMQDLMEDAEETRPDFENAMKGMMNDTGADQGKRLVRKHHKNDPTMSSRQNELAATAQYNKHEYKQKPNSGAANGLKSEERVQEKADQKYGGDLSRVLDVVRGTMTYGTMMELHAALKTVWNQQKEYGFEIVRCKQTYHVGAGLDSTFYGDVKFSIKMDSTEHVCELQFQHKTLLNAKDVAHSHYEKLRQVEAREKQDAPGLNDERIKKAAIAGNHRAYQYAHEQVSHERDYDKTISDVEALSAFLESGGSSEIPTGFVDVFEPEVVYE